MRTSATTPMTSRQGPPPAGESGAPVPPRASARARAPSASDTSATRTQPVDVLEREIAARGERHAHRLEITRRDRVEDAQRHRVVIVLGAFDLDTVPVRDDLLHRQRVRERRGLDAGNRLERLDDVLLQPPDGCASGTSCGGTPMRNVCNDSGSVKPGSTARSASNVRIIRPELTSSTSASATCPTTSAFCARCCPRPALVPREPRKLVESRARAARKIGARLNSAAATSVTSNPKPSERASSAISSRRGSRCGASASRDLQRAVRDDEPDERRPAARAGRSRRASSERCATSPRRARRARRAPARGPRRARAAGSRRWRSRSRARCRSSPSRPTARRGRRR